MEKSRSIYIADDDENIRGAIKTFLENEGYIVKAFENGDMLLAFFKINRCDLIILDVMMPGSDGFIICEEIRKISTVPIIMLTARDTDLDYATGISLGSDDYFTKPFSAMSLVMRVKAIFRRIEFEKQNTVDDTQILSFGDIVINTRSKEVSISGDALTLTPNEYDLLTHMFRNNDRAISRDELLRDIWGYQTEIETRATDDTVRRLRKKIQHSKVLVEAVWGFGFRIRMRDENE
jgi:Response regulators consisting of a CheY-like receiver domain and a winged-helix DNA-binding domain